MYQDLLRPLFFRLTPEQAHDFSFGALILAGKLPLARAVLRNRFSYERPNLERTVFGLKFKNPIGLAAGFDKDARLVVSWPLSASGTLKLGP